MAVSDTPVSAVSRILQIGKETDAGMAVAATLRLHPTSLRAWSALSRYTTPGATGSVITAKEQRRQTGQLPRASMRFQLRHADCNAIFAWAMGDNGGVPTLDYALPFYTVEANTLQDNTRHAGAYVNTAVFEAGVGQPFQASIETLAIAEDHPVSLTSLSIPTLVDEMLLFIGGTLSLGEHAVKMESFRVSIDNQLVAKQYSSLTPIEIRLGGKPIIGLSASILWNPYNKALYTNSKANTTVALSAVFQSKAGSTVTIAAPNCDVLAEPPDVAGDTDVMWDVPLEPLSTALGVGSTALTVTVAS